MVCLLDGVRRHPLEKLFGFGKIVGLLIGCGEINAGGKEREFNLVEKKLETVVNGIDLGFDVGGVA